MSLLDGFRAVQLGPGLAAAVCGRLLADAGAAIARIDPDRSSLLPEYLNRGSVDVPLAAADMIICEGSPGTLHRAGRDLASLRRVNARAALVLISPFGQTGPCAETPATDLTLFFASGIAAMLTGQVDDLNEPPMRPVGQQSAFIGGLAAACAGMHAALLGRAAVVDVSIQEALATLAMTELTRAGLTGTSWSRKRVGDGNGATVCILPARDGYAAISPREERQWASWLRAMGAPDWGSDARFATMADRRANWDALHGLMAAWSQAHDKQWIAGNAQAAHVPSFPLREPAEHLESAQLRHRRFFRTETLAGQTRQVPGSPFGLSLAAASVPDAGREAELPLAGIRVLDFSWVIAGPTATRYLAAMGADVIKIEAPGRGDPGRSSDLHTVLGQAKRAMVLDLKKPEAVAVAKALARQADVLVENFATGVMDRLGLGAEALAAINPRLVYVSASGLGRTGPESQAVAYGTLLQCYAGFAGLNRHPGTPPRVGMAWLDPMCGLMLAFAIAASLWRRRNGAVARVDFSMLEAMLWTMAEPLLASGSRTDAVYRCAGDDEWIVVDARTGSERTALAAVAAPEETAHWARRRSAADAAAILTRAGVPAAALARSGDLVGDPHLRARGFWNPHRGGVVPGLPWQASFGRRSGPAPEPGADTEAVLQDVLGMTSAEVRQLRRRGALG